MPTPANPGTALALALEHATRARALLAASTACHCGDEDCPHRDQILTAAAAAGAHAATAVAFAAIASTPPLAWPAAGSALYDGGLT